MNDGKRHDVHILDEPFPDPGSYRVVDVVSDSSTSRTSENAVKTPVWTASSVYVLAEIVMKRPHCNSPNSEHSFSGKNRCFNSNETRAYRFAV